MEIRKGWFKRKRFLLLYLSIPLLICVAIFFCLARPINQKELWISLALEAITIFFTILHEQRESDWKAAVSSNMFLETVSVDTYDIPGWAYTSIAQYLLYFIPPANIFYMLPMAEIKRKLSDWLVGRNPIRVRNREYSAYGVLLPLPIIRQECIYEKIEMRAT